MFNGALPTFDLDAAALLLAVVRALSVGALFVVFGTLLLRLAVAPPGLPAGVERGLARLLWVALGESAAATLAWLVVQAGAMAGGGVADALAVLPRVLGDTDFGTLIMVRLALLAAIAALLAVRRRGARALGLGFALLAVALQAGHLHALAMQRGPSVLLASEVLHVLAAATWLGGLPALLVIVAAAPLPLAGAAARRFSPIGAVCVLALAATAAWQAYQLVGGLPGVVGTAYGWACLGKLLLFAVLLGLAAHNRFALLPRLAGTRPDAARRALTRSIAAELVAGVLVVTLAAVLSGLQPGMHLQPVWPFAVRPSLAAVTEAPEFAREAGLAVAALAVAAALIVVGVLRRRRRWPAFAVAAVIAWRAAPHLSLLLVPAYPTSFYRSPTGFAADSIADGAALFATHCTACHGAEGRGDGPDAHGLPVAPADLTSAHLWMHSDGELFWWLTAGIVGPEGGLAMPGSGAVLGEAERWQLIDYIRAHNAGVTHAATGRWSPPVPAPDFVADCGGEEAIPLAELGATLRLVAFLAPGQLAPPPVRVPPDLPVVTILVAADGLPRQPSATVCVASDPAIRAAYGVVTGLPVAQLPGVTALIDRNFWLRETVTQPSAVVAALRRIAATPIPRGAAAVTGHHHQ